MPTVDTSWRDSPDPYDTPRSSRYGTGLLGTLIADHNLNPGAPEVQAEVTRLKREQGLASGVLNASRFDSPRSSGFLDDLVSDYGAAAVFGLPALAVLGAGFYLTRR